MKSLKYILFLILLVHLGVKAQKDSSNWHFGAKLNYSSVFYPERKPVMYYKYSQSYGASLFFEKILKRHPKFSFEYNIGFEILNLNQTLPVLDTSNVKYDPVSNKTTYKNHTNVAFKYYTYGLSFTASKKISSRYTFGIGLQVTLYNLKEKKGYSPFTWVTGATCIPNCRYYYATLDYKLDGLNLLPFLIIRNKFKLFNRNYLSLDMDIATLGFNYAYNAKKHEKYNGNLYAGINYDAINYLSFNYIFYFR